jgi:hypothetical protein
MCYCDDRADTDLLQAIQTGAIPRSALHRNCCWARICQVREAHRDAIPLEVWLELWEGACQVRTQGNLLTR